MKEAKAKNVLDGELFYCTTMKRFYRRTEDKCSSVAHKPNPAHIVTTEAKSGAHMCFMPDDLVVV